MDKESVYFLQLVDCNCNDCLFMERDLQKYAHWDSWNKEQGLIEFTRKKEKAISDAKSLTDERQRDPLLKKALKMTFQHKSSNINYGNCSKLNKPVSFIPGVCQPDTQACFQHRKQHSN